ncbi:hypothetical protein RND81_03G183300 [Saponaria officinalis]|uniref:Ankyrin repeat domain-containing protein n=1 Tax=Saponaria officinalis TaxID=3572 RepID=A0AAW1M9F9_SAPOF
MNRAHINAQSPVHKAIATKDYASLRKILGSLPRLADPAEIRTEAASVAEEEKAEAISAVIDRRDNVPNRDTPLHLAVKLGDETASEMLMNAGSDWSLQNEQGWSALQEAICGKQEAIAKIIVRHYQPLAWAKWCRRLPRLVATMRRMRDFYMEIMFNFESFMIPFISRIAPSDTYKIWKRGANLRADMTLAGFDGFRIQRADQSILFLGDGSEDGKLPPGTLCAISHKDKEITNALDGAGTQASEAEVQQEVADMSKTNIFRPGIDVTEAVLLPQLTCQSKIEEGLRAMSDDEFLNSCNGNETDSEELNGILSEEERKQLEVALKMDSCDEPNEGGGDGLIRHRHSCQESREVPIEDVNGSNSESKYEKKGWFNGWRKRDQKHEDQKKHAPPRSSISGYGKRGDLVNNSPSRSPDKPARHSVDVVRGDEPHRGRNKKTSLTEGGNRPKDTSHENEYKKGLRPILWLSPSFLTHMSLTMKPMYVSLRNFWDDEEKKWRTRVC